MGQALDLLRKSRIRIVGKKSSPARLLKFLDILAKVGVVTEAARQAGFCTTSAKYYMAKAENNDPGFVLTWGNIQGPFHELVKIALDMALENIEANVFRRANGYLVPQVHQGRVQYEIDHDAIALGAVPGSWDAILKDTKTGKPIPVTVEHQSEELQMFILKARRPDIYGNKSQVEMTMRGGVMVVGPPARTSEELARRAKKLNEPVDVDFIEVEDEDGEMAAANETSRPEGDDNE
jgi:hypothetical protein